jgi:hypothetical protein
MTRCLDCHWLPLPLIAVSLIDGVGGNYPAKRPRRVAIMSPHLNDGRHVRFSVDVWIVNSGEGVVMSYPRRQDLL